VIHLGEKPMQAVGLILRRNRNREVAITFALTNPSAYQMGVSRHGAGVSARMVELASIPRP